MVVRVSLIIQEYYYITYAVFLANVAARSCIYVLSCIFVLCCINKIVGLYKMPRNDGNKKLVASCCFTAFIKSLVCNTFLYKLFTKASRVPYFKL